MDVHTKQTRSYNMSRIKGKDTKPEMLVRRYLHALGYRYRLHVKNLPGKPDIVLPRYNTIIFIHGCFWHGHKGCRYYVVPKTRTDWCLNKINHNIDNDQNHKSPQERRLENNHTLGVPPETHHHQQNTPIPPQKTEIKELDEQREKFCPVQL